MRTGADRLQAPDTTITFEGRPVPARRGESVAAALAAAGIIGLRGTRGGGERGLFCGMGVCQECLVEIDGRANQRACLAKVEGPVAVRRQSFPGTPDPGRKTLPPLTLAEVPVETPQVLVIGAGIGGLAAAAAAAEAGAEVVLVDERPQAGGQFLKQPAAIEGVPPDIAADRQFAEGRAAIARARAAGVRFLQETLVWGAFEPLSLGVVGPGGSRVFKPQRLIVAAGAYERGLPLPGWTLPGVMTTGAAQTLLRSYRVLPGARILVAGNGPLNLQVADELARAGAQVVAVAELAPRPGPAAAGALWAMATSTPRLMLEGIRLAASLRQGGVPLLYGHGLAAIEPIEGGLRARLGRVAAGRLVEGPSFEADIVCMGYGFQPANEVLRALGCRHDYDPARGHLACIRDGDGRTSVAEVYGVGDCCGLGGARAAAEEGLIAGLAAAVSLGHTATPTARQADAAARARLQRHRRFQEGLWRLFAAPRFQAELCAADTLVCRCEEVTLGVLDAAMAEGHPPLAEVKRRTRAGMGRCQGRYCAPVLAALLAERQGRPLDEWALFAPRAPTKPVAIADLVRLGQP